MKKIICLVLCGLMAMGLFSSTAAAGQEIVYSELEELRRRGNPHLNTEDQAFLFSGYFWMTFVSNKLIGANERVSTVWFHDVPALPAGWEGFLRSNPDIDFVDLVECTCMYPPPFLLNLHTETPPNLMSGQMEWEIAYPPAVVPYSPAPDFHRIAAVSLREATHGSMALNGEEEIIFSFGEGVILLGARFDLATGTNNEIGQSYWYEQATYGLRISDGIWNPLLTSGAVSIMPTIDYEPAEILAYFYLSIRPGYEGLFGGEIAVTVSGSALGDFTAAETVAYAWDPIEILHEPLIFECRDIVIAPARPRFRLNDIALHETAPGALRQDKVIWVGFDNTAAHANYIHAFAFMARVAEGDSLSGLEAMQYVRRELPNMMQIGAKIRILNPSADMPGIINLVNAEASADVMPGIEYNIIIAGSAVANNWYSPIFPFELLIDGEYRQLEFDELHGFFLEVPYPTEALRVYCCGLI